MKTCPICKAGAFDDAEVCYGCLHRFSQRDETVRNITAGQVLVSPDSAGEQIKGAAETERHCESTQAASAAAAPGQFGGQPTVDGPCGAGVAEPVAEPARVKAVDIPVRNADVVVRIELVETASRAVRIEGAEGGRASASVDECAVLRRGRQPYVIDVARSAEVRRGAAAGQKGDCSQEVRARHAAPASSQQLRQAEIA